MTSNKMFIDRFWNNALHDRAETIKTPYDGTGEGEVPVASSKDAELGFNFKATS